MPPPMLPPPPIINVLQPLKKIESRKNRSVRLRSAGQVNYSDQVEEAEEIVSQGQASSGPGKLSKQPVEIKQPERKPVVTARLNTDTMRALLQAQDQNQ